MEETQGLLLSRLSYIPSPIIITFKIYNYLEASLPSFAGCLRPTELGILHKHLFLLKIKTN